MTAHPQVAVALERKRSALAPLDPAAFGVQPVQGDPLLQVQSDP